MKYEAEIVTFWKQVIDSNGQLIENIPALARMFEVFEWSDITGQVWTDSIPKLVVVRAVMDRVELSKVKQHPQHYCLWCRPVGGQDLDDGPQAAALPDTRLDGILAGMARLAFVNVATTREERSKRLRVLLRSQSIERA